MFSGSEGVEVEVEHAFDDRVADFHHTLQSDQRAIVDFTPAEQFGVVAEIAQKPVQLPQRFGCAVKAAGESVALEELRLEHTKYDSLERLLCIPAVLGSLNPGEEKTAGYGIDGGTIAWT